MRELLDSLHECPLLLDGKPVRGFRGHLPPDPAPLLAQASQNSCAFLLLEAGPQARSESRDFPGLTPLPLLRFRFSVVAGAAAGLVGGRYQEPLNLGSTPTQNEYELLGAARKKNTNLLILEDQGNLIWGRTDPSPLSRARALEVGGLILNKPHFYPVLLKRLLREKQIVVLSGRLPAGSPLCPYLSLIPSRAPRARAWAWIPEGGTLARSGYEPDRFHLFFPENEGSKKP